MQTPYEILGLSLEASHREIKQAYLQQLKKNPPDRDAEKFQCLHDAYLSIKDADSRLRYDLFTLPALNFDTFLERALHAEKVVTLDAEALQGLLAASVAEASFAQVFSGTEKE